jgi:D-lactate dehydrogenase (cytochrome)
LIRKTDPAAVRPYLEDASGMPGGWADEVDLPENAQEAAELLQGCQADGTAVTVSGGGTGLAGGRIPRGGHVLATDRLGGVEAIDRDDEGPFAVVGPATTLADLAAAAAEHDLFLPPDPTETLAWVGGAVATNASGSRTFHYGPMRRWVRRLEMVLPDGTVLDAARGRFRAGASGAIRLPGGLDLPAFRGPAARVKSASGFARGPELDLVDLVVGSEGTLALVTRIELRLLQRPEAVLSGIVFFPSEEACLACLRDARERSYAARGYRGPAPASPGVPARPAASSSLLARALEFFGGDALEFAREGGAAVPPAARAALLFEQEHPVAAEEVVAGAWMSLLEGHGALVEDSWFAQAEADRRRIREFRHSLPEGLNEWLGRHGRHKYGTDIAVPDEAFGSLREAYRRGLAETGLRSATFGHGGDNHLHLNLLPRSDAEEEAARQLILSWVRHAAALGGVPSAEHGIGRLKAPLFAAVADPRVVSWMRAVKTALDPAGILGRGVLLPD